MAAVTMALVSAALAGGSSILASKRAKKQARKEKRALRDATALQRSVQGTALDQQEAAIRRATQQRLGGLESAGRDAQRVVRDQQNQTSAALSQQLANSGLGSTTVGANLQRGVASDSSRTLSDLLSQLAQTKAGIEAGGTEALGNVALQRGDLMAGLGSQEILGMPGLNYQGPSTGENLLNALGSGLGTYTGMSGMGQPDIMAMLQQIYAPHGPNARLRAGQPRPIQNLGQLTPFDMGPTRPERYGPGY